MSADRYDFVIVGGGSAGCALANRLSADPGTTVLVLEAGRSDCRLDPFIHMPAALPYPDRQPALRLEVRDRARAAHERPAGLPRPRQGARRLEQHQRDDLPARQPDGLRALGRRPGMEDWDYPHCLPYFKRMETCLGRRRRVARRRRPAHARARPGRPTRCSARSSRPRQQAGYPLTDDVNGYRQEGFARFDRNVHRGRRLSRRPRLPAPGEGPQEPHRRDAGAGHQGPLRGQARGRRRLPARRPACTARVDGRRGHPLRRRDQHPAAAPALRRRRRATLAAARHRGGRSTCPASARTCRTTSRSTSSTPPSSRSRSRPGLRWRKPPEHRLPSGCSSAGASAPPTTSRAAASSAATRTSTTPT